MAIVHTGSLHMTSLSTDTKPEVPDGYTCYETDTGLTWGKVVGQWTLIGGSGAIGSFETLNLLNTSAANILLEQLLEEVVQLRQDMAELIASMNGKQYNRDTRWEEK